MFAMDAVRTGGGGSHGSLWSTCFPLRLRLLLPITLIIDWFSQDIVLAVSWPFWVVRICAIRDIKLTWYVKLLSWPLRHVNDIQYPFGSPRVGNEELAEYITGQGTLYRTTHTDDIVPKLPPGTWGYSHPAPEYWITSDNGATVTTGDVEVIQGTNSTAGNAGTPGGSVLAHLAYFVDISACP